MTKNTSQDTKTTSSNIINQRKFKTKSTAIIVLYPAENNYLTEGERTEDLIYFCDINQLKLNTIYYLTECDIQNTLQHQLKFSKILRHIKEQKPTLYPIVLLFEDLNNLSYLCSIADKVNEMIANGIIEIYITKGGYIFSKYSEYNYKIPTNLPAT